MKSSMNYTFALRFSCKILHFVHFCFHLALLNVTVLPTGLSDSSKNYTRHVAWVWEPVGEKEAQMHMNSGFYENFKLAPFFLGHPVYIYIDSRFKIQNIYSAIHCYIVINKLYKLKYI